MKRIKCMGDSQMNSMVTTSAGIRADTGGNASAPGKVMGKVMGKAAGKSAYRDFGKDESGSLVIFGLFVFVLMLMIGGMAVDLMRFETNRARLQSTLDRAVLAAASLDQPMAPLEVVEDYFAKAGLSAYLDPADVVVEDTLTARRVSAAATMDVDSTFLRLMGIEKLEAPAFGAAEESASRTEVSLVVDVSGSMGWGSSAGGSKISILRDAATQFVNIMMCNPEDPDETADCTVAEDTVSISMIPYAHQVLAGETVLSQLNVTAEHASSSCVTFVGSHFNSASMTTAQLFRRTGHFDPWNWTIDSTPWLACPTDPWRQILPMENDPADLRDAIADLNVWGATSVDIGMKWGSAFLDPAFQPVVDGLIGLGQVDAAFNDRPYSYVEEGIKKVVVLMTDGVNTGQPYLRTAYRDGPTGVWHRASDDRWFTWPAWGAVELDFPALWELRSPRWYQNLTGDNATAWHWTSTKNNRLDAICDAAKNQNITVFTIGFEVTTASATVMESCASSPAHFFDVEGEDLTDAFASIARSISALRLVN